MKTSFLKNLIYKSILILVTFASFLSLISTRKDTDIIETRILKQRLLDVFCIAQLLSRCLT